MMRSKHVPTEAEEQKNLFCWARIMSARTPELQLLFHVPNGGSRDSREAANLKAEGVKPGVPDLVLPVPVDGFHGAFIELKRQDGGRISPEQKQWMSELIGQGYFCAVCKGWYDAAKTISAYLRIPFDGGGGRQEKMRGI